MLDSFRSLESTDDERTSEIIWNYFPRRLIGRQ